MGTLATDTPAKLLKDCIVSGNSSLFTNWIFKFSKLPDTMQNVITLIDQGGPPSYSNLLIDFPGVQILIRGGDVETSYKDGYMIARVIRDIILGIPAKPASFSELTSVTERGTNPVPLGYDEKNRFTWSNNYQLIVEPNSNSLTHRISA